MTILVTGSTGGLGLLLTDWLKIHTKETIISTGRADQTHKDYIRCDLRDAEAFSNLIVSTQPRLIYHLSASFTECYDVDYHVNVLITQKILETLRLHKMKTRLVLMGSAAEYGFVSSEDNPVRETHLLRPISIYGLTKAFQTQYALYHAHHFGSDVVIARLFNLFAPGLSERLFIGHVEKKIKSYLREEITEIEVGNLNSYRDYVEANEAISQLT
ncbi:MAG: NAD-dependent epimerase/dehydratase family protein, partial [Bacteriovorax sp.]|nr:NAD-dependent epimerase/dehydratase family protein [Bacteriovorax sp.]